MVQRGRLSGDVPDHGEAFHVLLRHRIGRVEHIVSSATPDSGLYDQDDDELVLVLRGSATLEVDGSLVELTAGEHVFLPAHTPHRVLRTDAGTEWLAVHLSADGAAAT